MDANLIAFVRLAMSVIGDRLITIMGLSMSFGLGCWTMYQPTWERVTTLLIFVIFAYLVVRRKEKQDEVQA